MAIKITDNIKTWGPDLEKVHHVNFLRENKIRCRPYKTQVFRVARRGNWLQAKIEIHRRLTVGWCKRQALITAFHVFLDPAFVFETFAAVWAFVWPLS